MKGPKLEVALTNDLRIIAEFLKEITKWLPKEYAEKARKLANEFEKAAKFVEMCKELKKNPEKYIPPICLRYDELNNKITEIEEYILFATEDLREAEQELEKVRKELEEVTEKIKQQGIDCEQELQKAWDCEAETIVIRLDFLTTPN